MRESRVTALIPAGNEAHQIGDAVASVLWADEIFVVVDAASTDGTLEAVRALGNPKVRAEVHEYGYSAAQKNWAIPRASHPWIFLLDADERCTPELRERSWRPPRRGALPRTPTGSTARTSTSARIMKHGGWQTDKVIRLFRRECRYQDRRVHAEIEGWRTVGILRSPILHDTFRDWATYLAKLDRYTTWGAEQDFKDGKRAGFVSVVLRPVARLFKQYFLRLGFLDGIPGAIAAYLGVYGVFLKYAKLWDMGRRRRGAGERGAGERANGRRAPVKTIRSSCPLDSALRTCHRFLDFPGPRAHTLAMKCSVTSASASSPGAFPPRRPGGLSGGGGAPAPRRSPGSVWTNPSTPSPRSTWSRPSRRPTPRARRSSSCRSTRPGGYVTSVEKIQRAILQSKAPVVAYIAPAGGRAASGGAFVALACDAIAMAPGTSIGSAHPVSGLPIPLPTQPPRRVPGQQGKDSPPSQPRRPKWAWRRWSTTWPPTCAPSPQTGAGTPSSPRRWSGRASPSPSRRPSRAASSSSWPRTRARSSTSCGHPLRRFDGREVRVTLGGRRSAKDIPMTSRDSGFSRPWPSPAWPTSSSSWASWACSWSSRAPGSSSRASSGASSSSSTSCPSPSCP